MEMKAGKERTAENLRAWRGMSSRSTASSSSTSSMACTDRTHTHTHTMSATRREGPRSTATYAGEKVLAYLGVFDQDHAGQECPIGRRGFGPLEALERRLGGSF